MSALMHGYVDRTGAFVHPTTLRMAQTFHGGLAAAAPWGESRFGFLDVRGAWAMPCEADWLGTSTEGFTTFNQEGQWSDGRVTGGRWGLVGGGRVLVEARYDAIGTFAEGRIPFRAGGKWGFLDGTGAEIVPPRFEWAGNFSGGVAVAVQDGEEGYVSADGSWRMPPRAGGLWDAAEGRGRIKRGDDWFVIDLDGNDVSGPWEEIWIHRGGMAQVKRGEQLAFIGLDGRPIGDAWFDETYYNEGGQAPVRRGDEWFVLHADGTLHGPFAEVNRPYDGMVHLRTLDDRWRFLRADGRLVGDFDGAWRFDQGLGPARTGDRWTFVDRDGRPIAEPTWDNVSLFGKDGLAPVQRKGRWGAIDRTGRLVVPLEFSRLGTFVDGVASAQQVTWDREISPPPAGVTTLPAGGLQHPVFTGADAEDDLRVTVCFEPVLSDDALLRVRQLVANFKAFADDRAVGGEAFHGGWYWLTAYGLSIRLKATDDPVKLADLLMDELRAMDLPIKELTFLLLRDDPEVPPQWNVLYAQKPAAKHPDDPLGRNVFVDFEAYWDAVWDLDETAPRSENLFYLRIARFDRDWNVLFADRLLSLHVPGVRVCMGTMQDPGGYVDRRDDRLAEVEEAVTDALAERFSADRIWIPPFWNAYSPPEPGRHDWSPGVESVEYQGRKGYSFAIDPPKILHDVGTDVFRYREVELIEAVASVVAKLDLAPVILWHLFSRPLNPNMPHMAGTPVPSEASYYIVQIWER